MGMQDDSLPPRADRAMMARVLSALSDPQLGLRDLQVEYIEDTIVLRGRAPSETAREAAGTIALTVGGVAGVSNRIRVG